ncbi:MAG: alkaline phosphatase family protein, partial [Methanosarcinales archaeon]|nr:alkaline phosphatase family protein [Methanosarcinales archaeon]
ARMPLLDSKNPGELKEGDKHESIDKLAFRCRYIANHTTPAIASILTGVCPEIHRIAKTGDVYKSEHETFLEIANACGIKSAIVIENEGADAMRSKVEKASGVADSRNIIEYDTRIKNEAVKCLQGDIELVAIHFRALDRFAHEGRTKEELGYAASTIDRHIGDILDTVSDAGVIVCGDHPIHLNDRKDEEHVALIALRKNDK